MGFGVEWGKPRKQATPVTSQCEMRGWRQPLREHKVTHRPFGESEPLDLFCFSGDGCSFQGEEDNALSCLLKCATEQVPVAHHP